MPATRVNLPSHQGKHETLADFSTRTTWQQRLGWKGDRVGRHEVGPPDVADLYKMSPTEVPFLDTSIGPVEVVPNKFGNVWTVEDAYHAGVADGKMEEAYDRDSIPPIRPDLYDCMCLFVHDGNQSCGCPNGPSDSIFDEPNAFG